MKSIVHNPKNRRLLSAFGGLLSCSSSRSCGMVEDSDWFFSSYPCVSHTRNKGLHVHRAL